jgi:RNA recognition motif-containing protein
MSIYIGNIPYSLNDEDLAEHFNAIAPVDHTKIVRDKMTGKSKGFAFINLVNLEDEDKAIEAMDGYEIDGRKLRVIKAHNRTIHLR